MKRNVPCSRWFAFPLAMIYFGTSGVLAYAPEETFWAERRRQSNKKPTPIEPPLFLSSLPRTLSDPFRGGTPLRDKKSSALTENIGKTLPTSFISHYRRLFDSLRLEHGTIRKIWIPREGVKDRVVVYIQDIHQNDEAQRRISGSVQSLMESRQVDLVALEGAFAPIDVDKYHDFKDREVIGLTADCLLREKLVSGPVHAAMTTPAPLPALEGVDDPVHYKANVDAYRQSAPKIDALKKQLNHRTTQLEPLKAAVFSRDLSEFDATVAAYKEGRLALTDYVVALAPDRTIGAAGLFLQAHDLEKKLNFREVESKRKDLLELLLKRLNKTQVDQLVKESTGYRLGQIRYGDFYRSLQNLCRSAHIDLTAFAPMDDYIQYVLLSDQIDAEILMNELSLLEKARYVALAKTPIERELVTQTLYLRLAARLLDFSLTPGDWADYETLKSGAKKPFPLNSFESFYKEARARDSAIAENLLHSMTKNHATNAVLVTGGYHSPGVAHRLTQAGLTVISFTPRIEKVTTLQGSAYLSVFTQEKTPLEKLFTGEKLFISPDPGVQAANTIGPLIAVGATAVKSGIPEAKKTIGWFLEGVTNIKIRLKNGAACLDVNRKGRAAQIRVILSSEGIQFIQTTVTAFFGLALAYTLFPNIQWSFMTLTSVFTNTLSLDPFWNIMIAVTILLLSNINRTFFPSFISSSVIKLNQFNKKTDEDHLMTDAQAQSASASQFRSPRVEDPPIENSEEFKKIEKRYLKLLIIVRNLGWVVLKKRLISILKLTPSANADDFQNHMIETMTLGLFDLIVRTKKLSPSEAFHTLARFSSWMDFPITEHKALKEMAKRATDPNTPHEIKEEIRSFVEKRAQKHRRINKEDEIKQWVRIHQLLNDWSRKESRSIGNTGCADWHVLILLQLYLGDYLDSEDSMTSLHMNLPFLNPEINSVQNTDQIQIQIITRSAEGAHRAKRIEGIEWHGIKISKGKKDVIKNWTGEKIRGFLSDEAFLDRFLFFLYDIQHQEDSSLTNPVKTADVSKMLERLETKINKLHSESGVPNRRSYQATWLSSKVLGHILYFGLAWGVAAGFGMDVTSFMLNHWLAITTFAVITWPLSATFTGFNGVASLWEAWSLIKSPEKWALNHYGVKKDTSEFKELIKIGESLLEIYDQQGFLRMILEHNRYNFIQSHKSLREGTLFFFIFPFAFAHIIGHAFAGISMGLTWHDETKIFSKSPTFIFSSSPSPLGEGIIAMGGIMGEILLGSFLIYLLWFGNFGDFTIPARLLGTLGHFSAIGYLYAGLTKIKEPKSEGEKFYAETDEVVQKQFYDRNPAYPSDYHYDTSTILKDFFHPYRRTGQIFMTPLAQEINSPDTPQNSNREENFNSVAGEPEPSAGRAITINLASVREPQSLDEFDGAVYRRVLLSPTLQKNEEESLAKRLALFLNLNHPTINGSFASLANFFARGESNPSAARVAIPENLLNHPKVLTQIVAGTHLSHRGNLDVVFLVENQENAVRFKKQHPKSKVEVAPGLFTGESWLNLIAIEPHLPRPGRDVTIYKPHRYRVNLNGVHDQRLREKKLVDLETLAELVNRLRRMAEWISRQA